MQTFIQKQQQSQHQKSVNLTRSNSATSTRGHSIQHSIPMTKNADVSAPACVCEGQCPRCIKPGNMHTAGFEIHADAIGPKLGSLLPRHDGITASRLPNSVRHIAENYLGVDLNDVRLKTDRESRRELARANADACTVGSQIRFAKAVPALDSAEDRNLLGHELVHVTQQKKLGASFPQYRVHECGTGTGSAESQFADNHPGYVFNLFASGRRRPRPGQRTTPADELLFWNFCPGRTTPRTTHVRELTQAAQRWQRMRTNNRPQLRVNIIGGASSSGSVKRNEYLAFGRTQEIKRVLTTAGFPGSHIDTKGQGSRHPLAPNTSPQNMARNRRVEVVLYEPVTTTKIPWAHAALSGEQVGRVQDRPRHVAPHIRLNARFREGLNDRENILGIQGHGAMFTTANIRLTSASPVRAGFMHILTKDRRIATMRQRGGANPRPLHLDYSHCMGRIIPCRDHHAPHHIVLQGPGFYRFVELTQAGSTSGLAMANDSPGTGGPLRWPDPRNGPYFLEHLSWDMEFMLMIALVDRAFGAVEILQHAKWVIGADADISLRVGWGNRVWGHTATYNRRVLNHDPFRPGAPAGLDIAEAVTKPTCRMGARESSEGLHNLPCMPFEY